MLGPRSQLEQTNRQCVGKPGTSRRAIPSRAHRTQTQPGQQWRARNRRLEVRPEGAKTTLRIEGLRKRHFTRFIAVSKTVLQFTEFIVWRASQAPKRLCPVKHFLDDIFGEPKVQGFLEHVHLEQPVRLR